jgi:HD-GYP domain-containing protein (c-di-GMP phosphodiesterase class II)
MSNSKKEPAQYIDPVKMWGLFRTFLYQASPDFTEHGCRVAYIMLKLAEKESLSATLKRKMVFASYLHDIGADYEKDFARLAPFDPQGTYPHSLKSYLFLKYYSPLGEYSKALLYHHAYCNRPVDDPYFKLGLKIHICDRFDIANVISKNNAEASLKMIRLHSDEMFAPEDVSALTEAFQDGKAEAKLADGSFFEELTDYLSTLEFSSTLTEGYLLMLSFLFEIRNRSTLNHSQITGLLGMEISSVMGLPDQDSSKIYVAGLIHDLGKVALKKEILEKPGIFTEEEKEEMKKHVSYTYQIINGYFSSEIVKMAYRHHERLDGSGYPNGLKGDQMSVDEEVVQVANEIASLLEKKTYREAYTKKEMLSIMQEKTAEGKFNQKAVEAFVSAADSILADCRAQQKMSEKILSAFSEEEKELLSVNTWCK